VSEVPRRNGHLDKGLHWPDEVIHGKEDHTCSQDSTPQFKKDAVRLVRSGRSVSDVAQSLGIARSLLQRWRDQLNRGEGEVFPGRGKQSGEAEELRKLKQKLRDVTEERDILKKALAYFADDQK
jgi:transposase